MLMKIYLVRINNSCGSKVLMLGLENAEEAYYVCRIINAEDIVKVIDGYAISTNRGVDV